MCVCVCVCLFSGPPVSGVLFKNGLLGGPRLCVYWWWVQASFVFLNVCTFVLRRATEPKSLNSLAPPTPQNISDFEKMAPHSTPPQ